MPNFTHLHVHTQYSILDGASGVKELLKRAKELEMTALAITDHGNMYGAIDFYGEAKKNGIKPIIGCEVYVAEGSRFEKRGKEDRSGYHLILLAKNQTGYKNLSKLCSKGFLEGFYYTPRIDKEILRNHCEGIIALSACLGGEIPSAIMDKGEAKAEEVLNEYLQIFGEDFYLEVQNHGLADQQTVNEVIFRLSKKHNVKVVATNDSHFIKKEDADTHDILVCLNTGKDYEDPNRMKYSGQEYLKSYNEMLSIFPNHPEILENTQDVLNKIEDYNIKKDVILPKFPLPDGFTSEMEYLRHITYEGAEKRYGTITDVVKERIDFELSVVEKMGFPGYFLIVQDFIAAARKMGVLVGPGRGSAAGSAVAYCVGITSIDPIKYDLLFERFLNPERISMPDVDIDFDDEGRDSVLKYVIEKYGKERVAQIITFGSMAARSAIRDVARVLKLPLSEADKLAKLVPEGPKANLKDAYSDVPELKSALENGDYPLVQKTLRYALALEGSLRNTGVHACGVIIGPEDLIEHIPMTTAKDSDMPVIQFEGSQAESAGMLKMDFLGLKTLTIIKDTLRNIKDRQGIDVDIDTIPLDDAKTYELYSKGETTGTFQFESDGMKKYLQELQPNRFEDLIAMNALYRPGPIQYIPKFIDRKHGREKVEYEFPSMEKYLNETYGITVYQEQVMLLSQSLAGFTKGQADSLRKAMGKKQKDVMDKLKSQYLDGCEANNYDRKIAEKLWEDWEKFAEYAFNKSHSTCYAYVAYQTAYLKAHYPAEYMASVLSHNVSDIKKVTFFIDECKKMGIPVLGPDVNESIFRFFVNKKGEIRFGLGAAKGIGEGAVDSIVEERGNGGAFTSIFDFVKRINLRSCNKRCFEALAYSGAFDGLGDIHRAQFFHTEGDGGTFIDKLIKYGNSIQTQSESSQASLFGESTNSEIPDPTIPNCQKWSRLEQLKFERDIIGFYLSGHPLDEYKVEIQTFCNVTLGDLQNLSNLKGRELTIAGIVTSVNHRMTKTGNPFGSITLEDYNDSYQLTLFSNQYTSFKNFLEAGYFLFIKAKAESRFNQPDQLELKVTSMQLLSDVIEKQINSVTLQIPIQDLSDDLVVRIEKITKSNQGKGKLKFHFFDNIDKISFEMRPKKNGIDISPFVKNIAALGIKYKFN